MAATTRVAPRVVDNRDVLAGKFDNFEHFKQIK